MILAFGQNTNLTLSTTPEPFLATPRDVTSELAVETICWTGWGGTVGCSEAGHVIWGFAPSVLHSKPCQQPPTALGLPGRPRAYIGSESLEAVVGEAGHLYVPNETAGGWAFRLAKDMDEGGWLDVQQLGTGEFFGLHENDPSRIVRASSIESLNDNIPTQRTVPPATPTFSRIVAGSSHALLVPTAAHLHPPHVVGSNLHFQLVRPLSAAFIESPVAIEHLEGLGQLNVRAAGVYSLALTDAGEVYVWGGRFGFMDEALDLSDLTVPEMTDNADLEPTYVVAASVGSTGALVLGLSDGRIVATGIGEAQLLPTRPTDTSPAQPAYGAADGERGWRELRGKGGGGRLKDVVIASGGRGWFLVFD